jgi:hypothetical protein
MTLDHILLAGPELEPLEALVRERTGVVPVRGGRHLGHGTHNALVDLGVDQYLELLAVDPAQGGGPFAATIAHLRAPALHTWCAQAGAAATVAERARALGLTPRRERMQRRRPDRSMLAWELVFLDGHPYGPLVPFFIDWQKSKHPTAALPRGVKLLALVLTHPDADGLRSLLTNLGGVPDPVRVEQGATPGIAAELRHEGGSWTVEGPPADTGDAPGGEQA